MPLWLWQSLYLARKGGFAGRFCYRPKKWHVRVASAFSLARLAEREPFLNPLHRGEMGIEAVNCEAGGVSRNY